MSAEFYRNHIEAQTCPFCGKGPFKSLVQHTGKGHGVDKWELRDLAGLTSSDPISSPELRAQMAERYAINTGLQSGRKRNYDSTAKRKQGKDRNLTVAGRKHLVSNLQEWEQANPGLLPERNRRAGIAGAKGTWGDDVFDKKRRRESAY